MFGCWFGWDHTRTANVDEGWADGWFPLVVVDSRLYAEEDIFNELCNLRQFAIQQVFYEPWCSLALLQWRSEGEEGEREKRKCQNKSVEHLEQIEEYSGNHRLYLEAVEVIHGVR